MISEFLFDSILVNPVKEGANRLYIVSGYATAAMAFHHLRYLQEHKKSIQVSLIVGMCPIEGLAQSNHKGFIELKQKAFHDKFECSYLTSPPQVHSKVYAWFKNDTPICGFTGSANYTQTAFGKKQREAMALSDAEAGLSYFNSLIPDTIYCDHPEAENIVNIFNDRYFNQLRRTREATEQVEAEGETVSPAPELVGLPFVRVSFLDKYGELPDRSGLNWGQRPEEHREQNQAYIKLPASVYKTDFFPDIKVHFTVLTDDGKVLICTRAQQNGKAIHTPHNNSLIGEYFRNRIGAASGSLLTLGDLLRYGRTDAIFYKIDDETYYMDFSVA